MNLLNRSIRLIIAFSFIVALSGCTNITEPNNVETNKNIFPVYIELGKPANLPLPGSLPLVDYEKKLYRWVMTREYVKLGWLSDKEVRDTGPFINGQYYGTHPAVHIYYSPEVMQWLVNNRQGELPDGAMIIKEMYKPPAAIYNELAEMMPQAEYEKLRPKLISDWTVMVKSAQASSDGWFWGSVSAPSESQTIDESIVANLDTLKNGNARDSQLRSSGFALPCIRCHASAESEMTFASLRNIEGFLPDEDPLRFLSDTSWRTSAYFDSFPLSLVKKDGQLPAEFNLPDEQLPWPVQAHKKKQTKENSYSEHERLKTKNAKQASTRYVNKVFLDTFKEITPIPVSNVKKFPQQWLDHVVQKTGKPQQFITSDNCIGCHGGLAGDNYAVSMFIKTGPDYGDGFDISEYGEWRWSPMGLAGRDPIFHAQLESEMAILEDNVQSPNSGIIGSLKDNQQAVTNTCLSCHGAMGQRELAHDAKTNQQLNSNMKIDYYYMTEQLSSANPQTEEEKKYHKYGELAREGISCMVCHHIERPTEKQIKNWQPVEPDWINSKTPKELAYSLFHNNTGRFESSANNKINGPYEVMKKPMKHAINVTPEKNEFIQDSQLCGTCHTINLPNIGATKDEFPVLNQAETNPAFKNYNHSIEQATFLEWQNSTFASGKNFKSCQDCHMKSSFETLDGSIKIDKLVSQIATIEDNFYPDADHGLANNELNVPLRPNYKRHTHVGLNAFLLEMFKQFDSILGVSKNSYMTSASHSGVDLALESMALQAAQDTLDVDVKVLTHSNNQLKAEVTVKNKTGHRFPSGVAFRRSFIEFLVKDGDKVVWGSGQTNAAGVIVDNNGEPLATEFLPNKDSYQKHHQMIKSDKQVQIYEELVQNKDSKFTTSFIHRVHHVKDNRLLPRGWRESSFFKTQGEVMYQFMQATDPEHVGNDPDYQDVGSDFKGQDKLVYEITLPEGYADKELTVQATLYFQAVPPYWFKQRFSQAPNGIATQRLFYLASHLDLNNTAMKNWKFRLTSDSKTVSIK